MRNVILCGDVREQLRLIPDETVHCIVTSPPYWGLRDYGTAAWAGGDEGCDHLRIVAPRNERPAGLFHGGTDGGNYAREPNYRHECGKCGAVRIDSQIGLEATPEKFVANMVEVFREVRRVLRKDGTLWLNLGDSYNTGTTTGSKASKNTDVGYWQEAENIGRPRINWPGLKPKDMCGIPWRVAFALQADGWWLRSDIIWAKPNPMPESVTDRPTKAHEYLFLFSKGERYYYDHEAIREPLSTAVHAPGNRFNSSMVAGPMDRGGKAQWERDMTETWGNPAGRNRRTVWTIPTQSYEEAHFATYPEDLVKPCILAGTSEHGCCSVCGAPWRRVTELTDEYKVLLASGKAWRDTKGKPDEYTNRQPSDHPQNVPPKNVTTGWAPTCKHEAPLTPAVVLDPFLGSGTTALVAKNAGRDWIGVELNPTYVELAKARINVAQERLL